MSRASDHTGPDRLADGPRHPNDDAPLQASAQPLWQWVAVGLLVICWIAEAAMCADRGF
jgi:hypothetical protein